MSNTVVVKAVPNIGLLGILGIVFVTLKLTGYIDWSWLWVTAPFWGGFAVFFLMLFIAFVIWLIVTAINHNR